MDELKVTSAEEFYKSENVTKVIKLPSGLTVRIRKIYSHTILGKDKPMFLQSSRNIAKSRPDLADLSLEERKAKWVSMSDEDRAMIIEINNDLICDATIEPIISKVRTQGVVFLADIDDKDYNKLVEEIQNFSLPKADKLRPFRAEPVPSAN